MKVLFVCSGNVTGFDVVPFIKEQGESVRKNGVEIEYFPVIGKGFTGYIKQALDLRKFLKKNKFDLIHGHFVLSAWVAVLGSRGLPVVISLMGSDAYGEYIGENKITFKSRFNTLLTYLIQPFVKAIISKSPNIERYVFRKKISHLVPNGIDINKFKPLEKEEKLADGFDPEKQNVLFLGSGKSVRKNMALAKEAISLLDDSSINLVNPYPIAHHEIPKYLNQTDVLAMCSYMEGSPNVIKEAMACNCPLVATDVGDVKWVLGEVEGCYISPFNAEKYAEKLKSALFFAQNHKRTKGRDRIHYLKLDAGNVANQLISIYKSASKTK